MNFGKQRFSETLNPGSIVPKGPKFAQNCCNDFQDNHHFLFSAKSKMVAGVQKIKIFYRH